MGGRYGHLTVLIAAALVAAVSARNHAGGWNDGSRLATVECLVDHHTLAIDQSIFVKVPAGSTPYPKHEQELLGSGTGDKLFIDGHYYSDKSPVPALLMAGLYECQQWLSGRTARENPSAFCYWLTVLTSGLSYVVAVCCVYRLGGVLALGRPWRVGLTASLAVATIALTYIRHVNNHILLLGVMAPLVLGLVRTAQEGPPRPFALGTLAGMAYTIDLGAGPVIFICTLALVAYRWRRPAPIALFVLSAVPWLVLHHGLNYSVGGTWKPANAVVEYFNWPGCTFNAQNMTGTLGAKGVGHQIVYAAALLAGKRGFLGHNLALFLVLPGLVVLCWRTWSFRRDHRRAQTGSPPPFDPRSLMPAARRPAPELPEVIYAVCCGGGVWLAYALTSSNSSGPCCSIRWFVPLLAPGYFVLAVLLRDVHGFRRPFVILSVWGAVLGLLMWYVGPWTKHLVPLFWPIQAAAFLTLVFVGRSPPSEADAVHDRGVARAA